jgi:hypothetical protein
MLSWEQMDKLNEIATNSDMTAECRTQVIRDFMCTWGMLVNEGANAWDYTPNWADPRIPREPVIDAGKASTHARIPIPGQVGRTVYPGYYQR